MATKFWWLVHKDLVAERRARQVWPAMLLVGAVVVFVLSIQTNPAAADRRQLAGGLLWLAIFFAGTIALDRAVGSEREDGCLDALRSYPITTGLVYAAKLAVNVVALACLECVLVPLFVVFFDVPLARHPAALVLVLMVGNVGLAAVGTLLSALATGTRHRASLLVLVLLPIVVPVLLGAAEATRLTMAGDFGDAWLRWVQLLAAFAVIFSTAGVVLFGFLIEE